MDGMCVCARVYLYGRVENVRVIKQFSRIPFLTDESKHSFICTSSRMPLIFTLMS